MATFHNYSLKLIMAWISENNGGVRVLAPWLFLSFGLFEVPPRRNLGTCDNAISKFSSGLRNPVRSRSKYGIYIFIKSQRFGHCSHVVNSTQGEGHVCIADKGAFPITNHSLGIGTKNEPMCLTESPGILVLEISWVTVETQGMILIIFFISFSQESCCSEYELNNRVGLLRCHCSFISVQQSGPA